MPIAPRRRREPSVSAVLVTGLILVACAAVAARADIHLAVATDQTYGLTARLDNISLSKTTAENPIQLVNGGSDASFSQNGSDIEWVFHLRDPGQEQAAFTSSGDLSVFNPLRINIVGTAGEAVGTPVSLHVFTHYEADNFEFEVRNIFNGTEFDDSGQSGYVDKTFTDFKVGDSFTYLAGIQTPPTVSASFRGMLSVSPAANGPAPSVPVPEPTSLVLMAVSGLLWVAPRATRRLRAHARAADRNDTRRMAKKQ